jgi:4-carboxymuconolactone decarboxylase
MTRGELRRRGEAMRTRLFGARAAAVDPLIVETTYGAVWSRPGLALPDRMVCTLAALCAVQQLTQLRRYVHAALDIGVPEAAPFTIFLQIGIYAGFAASESAAAAANEVYRERGVALPQASTPDASMEVLDARGRDLMANLHGDRGVKGYAAPENPFTNRLYPMTIPYGYGEIWHRPGLELRQRAMVSLAGFTALQMPDQLKKFGPSAPNVGLTLDEVCEAIIQTAPYSGYAPALNALRWLSEVC